MHKGDPGVSHLLFADDMLLFFKVNGEPTGISHLLFTDNTLLGQWGTSTEHILTKYGPKGEPNQVFNYV